MKNKPCVTDIFKAKKILLVFVCLLLVNCGSKPRLFPNRDLAVRELKAAIENRDRQMAAQVLGEQSEFFFDTGDSELDRTRVRLFLDKFAEFHDLQESENNQYQLLIGKNRWPFPAPLVEKNGYWYFDSKQGVEAIKDRIIGSNELSAISVLESIYFAQEYFKNNDSDQNRISDYAEKIVSSKNKKDGLFWPHEPKASPLFGLFVQAAQDGFEFKGADRPQPFRGYYFKILQADKDRFTALAYPAAWGNSGYMSFIIDEKSWVYEKNLKEEFNLSEVKLDQSWERIQ